MTGSAWAKARLRFLVDLDPAVPREVRESGEQLASFVPMEAVGEDGSLDASCERPTSSLVGSYTYFADGDVLVAKVTPCFENGKGAIARGLIGGIGFATTEVYALRPSPLIDARFLDYLLRSSSFRQYGAARLKGAGGLRRVSAHDLLDFVVILPLLSEQRSIASYLDCETARIDTLIAEQQRLIEMLLERRGAVLESDVAQLDWSTPLGAVSSLVQTGPFGSQLKSEEYEDGGVPVINPSHLVRGEIVPDPRVAVGEAKASDLRRHVLNIGDVVVARRGELGRCAVVDAKSAGFICGTGSALIRPEVARLVPHFLALVFGSRRNKDVLALASVGSTMDNLNADIVSALRIPAPSIDEQRRIVSYLDEQTAKIDNMIAETERFIELALERRSALITAAVTGQIDVVEVA